MYGYNTFIICIYCFIQYLCTNNIHICNKGRRKGFTAIITGSPYKRFLISNTKKGKIIKKKMVSTTRKNKSKPAHIIYKCVICVEDIDDSIDSSVQCNQCLEWCHELCIDIDTFDICDLCK